MQLPLFPGQLVVFGLFLSRQRMPLLTKARPISEVCQTLDSVCVCVCNIYPSSKDLVDGSALFQGALCHHFGSHLLHIQHESVQRFLDMRLLVLFFLVRGRGLPANDGRQKGAVNKSADTAKGDLKHRSDWRPVLLRLHRGADVIPAGLLFDCRGDNSGVRDARLVEAVWRRSHHVRGEPAGHQAARGNAE